MANQKAVNVYGETLQTCSLQPLTGFLRDGGCRIGPSDVGRHGACAQVTDTFLEVTRRRENDLSTPQPAAGFPGLKPGDRWCVCRPMEGGRRKRLRAASNPCRHAQQCLE